MKHSRWLSYVVAADVAIYFTLLTGCGGGGGGGGSSGGGTSSVVVFAYNDLGMHCMNEDFSELCILPPANTLRALVIERRGEEPRILTSGVLLNYSVPGNLESMSKTNFWQFAPALFGSALPDNQGLFGFGLSGNMQLTSQGDFWAPGIPVTPKTDLGVVDPYQLAQVEVFRNSTSVALTQAVVPVSWEIKCDNCHTTAGISVATDILRRHDTLHSTTLESHKPVLCASCHSDAALGTPGVAGIPPLSTAMHGAHADRMGGLTGTALCYECHPGPDTDCLRDVHKSNGLSCQSCHDSMAAVGNPGRKPWIDEPRCGTCHQEPGHEYEQANTLFRDSKGHNGVKCIACHGSPHAIGPSSNPRDNTQAIRLQGFAGPISKCTVCHTSKPDDSFNHTRHRD